MLTLPTLPPINLFGSPDHAKAAAGVMAATYPAVVNQAGAMQQQAMATPAAFGQTMGGMFGAYAGGLGSQGNNYTNAYGAYTQGMGDLGRSQTGMYNSYAGGLGQIGQAMAADRAGFYGANAGAEAARQVALGNIGSSALSAFGGASNKALESWAQNQLAYNQALAQLGTANQAGLSQLGQSRNAALGSLGNAYASLGGRLGAASVLGNLNFNISDSGGGPGGSGFQATGPNGEIASGSYGSGGGLGGFSASGSRTSDTSQLQSIGAPAYAGMGSAQHNLMASDISDSMNRNYTDGMDRLDAQHYSSRNMPSQMLGQTLSGLMTLGRDAYGQVRGGMDQFYATQNDPRNRADYGGMADRLATGYGNASGRLDSYAGQIGNAFGTTGDNIRSVSDTLRSGYGQATRALRGLFDDSIGRLDMFQTPATIAQRNADADAVKRVTGIRSRLDALEDSEANARQKALQYRNSPYAQFANFGPGTTSREAFVDRYTREADQSRQERELLRRFYNQTLNPNSPAVQSWIDSQRDAARLGALRAEQERGLAEFDGRTGMAVDRTSARSAFARDRARLQESLLG